MHISCSCQHVLITLKIYIIDARTIFYIRYILPSYQKSCINFFSAQHYIRLQDRRNVFLFFVNIIINFK